MATTSLLKDIDTSLLQKVTPFAEVRECRLSGHKSLYATQGFAVGEQFFDLGAKTFLEQPNYLTVQVDQTRHMMLDPEWLQYINHSCDPNVHFDLSQKKVVVIKPIAVGEEITFFYPSTEWSMQQAFDCLCNSQNCLGRIQGAKYVPQEVLACYRLSDCIQEKISTTN